MSVGGDSEGSGGAHGHPGDRGSGNRRTAPLAGVRVLVTRTREQAAALAGPLEALGAEVVLMPVIEVAPPVDPAPLEAALERLQTYDWLILTSVNAVKLLFARLGVTADAVAARLSGVRIAAVGTATAARIARFGIEPDLVPEDFRAEGLVESLREFGVGPHTYVLIPRAAEARAVLPDELRAMGARVDAVDLYRLVSIAPDQEVLDRLSAGEIDVIAFASGSTARHFVSALEAAGVDAPQVLAHAQVASVGPVTSEALQKMGIHVAIEAEQSTMASLVAAIAKRMGGPEG